MKQFMLAGLALQLCALPALAADKTAAVPSNAPTTMTTADPHPMAPATTAKPMTSPAEFVHVDDRHGRAARPGAFHRENGRGSRCEFVHRSRLTAGWRKMATARSLG